ncbi:MAG: ribonuclease Z [Bacteroidales bacterium]
MTFELTILGSSSALPTASRFPTAHLLQANERFFLIDCGEGTQMQLRRYGKNPARIHHIFISHLHGDHVFGLFGLLSTMGLMGRTQPLHLYGPEALRDLLQDHLRMFGPLPFPYVVHGPGNTAGPVVYEDKNLEVRRLPLRHRTITFGYLFREKHPLLNIRTDKIQEHGLSRAEIWQAKQGHDIGRSGGAVLSNGELTLPPYHARSYAYISDTAHMPGLAEELKGVDLLYHEATFMDKDSRLAAETGHSTASQAASLARDAGAGRLLLGHFSSRYRDLSGMAEEARSVFPATDLVTDGEVDSLPRRRTSPE